jgi:hypothetical protein
MRFSIIEFGGGSFGVYCAGRRHPITGLPLLFRGTLDEVIAWRRAQ